MMDVTVTPLDNIPYYQEKVAACFQEVIEVPSVVDKDLKVPVYIHRPKKLVGDKNAAIVYAHGGGVIAGTAKMFGQHCSTLADICGVVVFNVDYRLGPEAKCPKNVEDMYSALMHVVENAEDLKVDKFRIGLLGESG